MKKLNFKILSSFLRKKADGNFWWFVSADLWVIWEFSIFDLLAGFLSRKLLIESSIKRKTIYRKPGFKTLRLSSNPKTSKNLNLQLFFILPLPPESFLTVTLLPGFLTRFKYYLIPIWFGDWLKMPWYEETIGLVVYVRWKYFLISKMAKLIIFINCHLEKCWKQGLIRNFILNWSIQGNLDLP